VTHPVLPRSALRLDRWGTAPTPLGGIPANPQPARAKLMAQMRMKTLIVCVSCHQAIHASIRPAVAAWSELRVRKRALISPLAVTGLRIDEALTRPTATSTCYGSPGNIQQDDAVLGRDGDEIDGGAVVHLPVSDTGQVPVRTMQRDLSVRMANVDQGDAVLEVPPIHVRGGASGAVTVGPGYGR